nr:MAG TPA: hypothetical protein [Caudoviricetes sp.]
MQQSCLKLSGSSYCLCPQKGVAFFQTFREDNIKNFWQLRQLASWVSFFAHPRHWLLK